MLVVVSVAADELLAVFVRIASLSTRWLCRSRSGLSLDSCHDLDVDVVELVEEEADVDSGCMLIELRLMKDDVRVVERVNAVFVGSLWLSCCCFLFWFDETPKNDSSCSRSCRAPDDSRSEARSSFRAVPFVVEVVVVVEVWSRFVLAAAFGMYRLKCGDSNCCCCGCCCC